MGWDGVFVATVTPFSRANGGVDLIAYKKHLEWLSASGVHGFVPCGTTGEGVTLSSEERVRIIECSCEVAQSKNLKVIAGCGSNATDLALKMILEAKEIGAHAVLVVTPYYNKPTQEGLLAHYHYLADESPMPIILYNVPSRTGVSLQLGTIAKLFEHGNIVGIKEASGHYDTWLGLSATIDLTKKSLLAGDDDAFAVIRQLGGTGIISASANVIPDLFVKLYELSKQGKWTQAFELQKVLYPMTKALFLETNPSPAKEALSQLRRMEEHVRLPLVSVSKKTATEITAALKNLGLL